MTLPSLSDKEKIPFYLPCILARIYKYLNKKILTYKITQHWMKSSNKIVPLPYLSNFLTSVSTRPSDSLYPNEIRAVFSSCLSMFPELSLSKLRKQFCQSVTYFHSAPKSSKVTWPIPLLSNIPIISLTVSGLKGLHVPFDSAACNSDALMAPLLSRSTLTKRLCDASGINRRASTYFVNTSHRNSRLGIGELKCDIAEAGI